jgi:hypothetical protein
MESKSICQSKNDFMDFIDLAIEYYWVQLIILKSIHEMFADIDWQRVTEAINEKGYAMVSQFLPVGIGHKWDMV